MRYAWRRTLGLWMLTAACGGAIFSIICCFLGPLLGPGAIVMGILALKKWTVQESSYGATTSKIRAWIGIVTGVIGTIVGIVAIIIAIVNSAAGPRRF